MLIIKPIISSFLRYTTVIKKKLPIRLCNPIHFLFLVFVFILFFFPHLLKIFMPLLIVIEFITFPIVINYYLWTKSTKLYHKTKRIRAFLCSFWHWSQRCQGYHALKKVWFLIIFKSYWCNGNFFLFPKIFGMQSINDWNTLLSWWIIFGFFFHV